jgi:hypothetical protein
LYRVAVDFHEHRLQYMLRLGRIAQDFEGDIEDQSMITIENDREGVPVAGFNMGHKNLVGKPLQTRKSQILFSLCPGDRLAMHGYPPPRMADILKRSVVFAKGKKIDPRIQIPNT